MGTDNFSNKRSEKENHPVVGLLIFSGNQSSRCHIFRFEDGARTQTPRNLKDMKLKLCEAGAKIAVRLVLTN